MLKEDVADLHVELQRVPEPKTAKTRIHFDIETDDVAAEVARLEALGARPVEEHAGSKTRWWVMQDPCGSEFCVTSVQSEAWPKKARSWDRPISSGVLIARSGGQARFHTNQRRRRGGSRPTL